MAISEAMRRANRANALRSTGPRSERGKARSRLNAAKHGLTGRGVVLPQEDHPRFVALEAALAERFAAAQADERGCIREIAAALWRLGRVPLAEAAVFEAVFAGSGAGDPLETAKTLVDDLLRIGRYASQAERAYERSRRGLMALQARRRAGEQRPTPLRLGSNPQICRPNGFVSSKCDWAARASAMAAPAPAPQACGPPVAQLR